MGRAERRLPPMMRAARTGEYLRAAQQDVRRTAHVVSRPHQRTPHRCVAVQPGMVLLDGQDGAVAAVGLPARPGGRFCSMSVTSTRCPPRASRASPATCYVVCHAGFLWHAPRAIWEQHTYGTLQQDSVRSFSARSFPTYISNEVQCTLYGRVHPTDRGWNIAVVLLTAAV